MRPTLIGRVCELAQRGPIVSPGSLVPWLDRAWFERIVFAAGQAGRVLCQGPLFHRGDPTGHRSPRPDVAPTPTARPQPNGARSTTSSPTPKAARPPRRTAGPLWLPQPEAQRRTRSGGLDTPEPRHRRITEVPKGPLSSERSTLMTDFPMRSQVSPPAAVNSPLNMSLPHHADVRVCAEARPAFRGRRDPSDGTPPPILRPPPSRASTSGLPLAASTSRPHAPAPPRRRPWPRHREPRVRRSGR